MHDVLVDCRELALKHPVEVFDDLRISLHAPIIGTFRSAPATPQRICGHKIVLGQCGVNIRGLSPQLRLNCRRTEQARAWAASLLEGQSSDDLAGGRDDKRIQSLARGPEPVLTHFASDLEQSDTCILGRLRKVRDRTERALEGPGLPVVKIGQNGDDRRTDGVRLATVHRVKGLELESVVLVSANDGSVPLTRAPQACPAIRHGKLPMPRKACPSASQRPEPRGV